MSCRHLNVQCLNHYDTFRKYLCEDCGEVWMCECERELAITFLSHQTRFGSEYGTHKRYPVSGFVPGLCAECRGEAEEPHPRAAIYGQKGRVERFYWREIYKTYLTMARDWMLKHGIQVRDVLELESRFLDETKKMKKEARRLWQEQHKHDPKYDTSELTEIAFLQEVSVPQREIEASYVQIERSDQKLGKWINEAGNPVSAEDIAAEHYRKGGFSVWTCERRLIAMLVGTFCCPVIQDPTDPRIQTVMRGSTRGWTSQNRDTPLISFPLPEDFGSREFYFRRKVEFRELISELRETDDLGALFEELLEPSTLLRDYLWVNEGEAVGLARAALKVIPHSMIVDFVDWAIRDFWQRQPGWPDLLLLRSDEFLFSEVKSPHDKLSLEQMQWFRWAVEEAGVACEICRVRRAANFG